MKHFGKWSRIAAGLMTCVLCLPLAVSCAKKNDVPDDSVESVEPGETPGETDLKLIWDGKAMGRVVYPLLTSPCAGNALTKLQSAVKISSGVSLKTSSDSLFTAKDGEPVILLGDTSVPESAQVKAALPENSFSVRVENGTVVVVATNDALYGLAIDHLLSVCTAGNGTLTLPVSYQFTSESYPSVEIFSESDRNFRIVYDTDDSESKTVAGEIAQAIREQFGFSPETVGDSQPRSGKEILVGNTNRAFSKANLSYFMDYTVNVDQTEGVVALTGYLPSAGKALCDMIKSSENNSFSVFPVLMGTQAAEGYGSIPAFREVTYDLMNMSDLYSYYVLYYNSNAEEYQAYLGKLEGMGYTRYAYREVNGNLFATYTDGFNLLNVNFTAYTKITKIAAETVEHAALGKQESDLGEVVTTPQLTQINGACAFILRLSDGRFIVMDGGLNYEKNWKRIYDQLCEQNVLEGKPVIAAWFLSHAHTDHYGGFIGFADNYGNKVTLQNVVLNIPSYEVYSKNTEAADTTPTMKTMIERAKQAISTRYSSANIIIPHAGQIMWFGDAMIDMLYTHEDLAPSVMKVTNSSSLIYTITIAGQKMSILNDAHDDSSTIVHKMYGDTLKCDIVQVAHHGFNGGNTAMYKKMNADTALWTSPYQTVIERSLWNSPRNHFDINSVKENLMMEDESVMILPLPHAVGSAPDYVRTFS